jgi:hypothetical protein
MSSFKSQQRLDSFKIFLNAAFQRIVDIRIGLATFSSEAEDQKWFIELSESSGFHPALKVLVKEKFGSLSELPSSQLVYEFINSISYQQLFSQIKLGHITPLVINEDVNSDIATGKSIIDGVEGLNHRPTATANDKEIAMSCRSYLPEPAYHIASFECKNFKCGVHCTCVTKEVHAKRELCTTAGRYRSAVIYADPSLVDSVKSALIDRNIEFNISDNQNEWTKTPSLILTTDVQYLLKSRVSAAFTYSRLTLPNGAYVQPNFYFTIRSVFSVEFVFLHVLEFTHDFRGFKMKLTNLTNGITHFDLSELGLRRLRPSESVYKVQWN